ERERENLVKILLYIFDVIEIKIQEIATIKRGRVISKKEIKQSGGKYPVYSSQTENAGILGYINTYDFDGEYLTWTTDGSKAGTVFYRNGQFNITNVCGLINPIHNIVNPKFLYYCLTTKTKKYVNKNIANAKLMSNVMANIKILLPNLNIQNKIVNLLNTFEHISRNINVGLPAEINLREKQYTYYLNKIFNILNKN
ncbi:restriction endonuclease subunit S, partial [Mycoplasmopsis gallinarum]